ncbi:MAG: hypothetical protein KKG47_06765 [Proteobacteria bacterium]|nr:hypothetical protein [Pseudomonadota bacterium]MBU1739724.1 hypothetical protein [Pseudomonadota bacterium]
MKPKCHQKITKKAIQIYLDNCQNNLAEDLQHNKWSVRMGSSDADTSPLITRAKNWHFYKENDFLIPFKGKLFGFPITYTPTSDEIFSHLVAQLKTEIVNGNTEEMFLWVGRILHHIQDMSTPSHVVPIFHGPFIDIEEGADNTKDAFEEFSAAVIKEVLIDIVYDKPTLNNLVNDSGLSLQENYVLSAENTLTLLFEGNQSKIDCMIDGQPKKIGFDFFWKKNDQSLDDEESKHGFGHYGILGNRFSDTSEIKVPPHRYKISYDSYLGIYRQLISKMVQDSTKTLSIIAGMLPA